VQLAEQTRHLLVALCALLQLGPQPFGELLARVNANVEEHEQLAFIAVATEPWLFENSFLTPTLKLIRGKAEAAYTPRADAWYAEKTRVFLGA